MQTPTPTKKPHGKPKSDKTAYLGFRVTEDHIQTVEKAAEQAHQSVSDYVREAIRMRVRGAAPAITSASMTYTIVRDGHPILTVFDSQTTITRSKARTVRLEVRP